MTLDEKCKEIAKDAIKDYSILSENMLKKEESYLLKTNWNAFLLGLIADQSVKAEMAWRLPYNLEKRLGYFDFERILKEESVESLENIIKEKPALGTLLLVRDFGVSLENLSCIDIAYDVHVRRVFLRMGLVEKDNIKEVTEKARFICKNFSGSLTLPFWVVGREYCRPQNPKCSECRLSEFCEKKIELGTDI